MNFVNFEMQRPHPEGKQMQPMIRHGRVTIVKCTDHTPSGKMMNPAAPMRSKISHVIEIGEVFSNGVQSVRIMKSAGSSGLRLDQHPSNGLVFAPWFRGEKEVMEYLARGGHTEGDPFLPDNRAISDYHLALGITEPQEGRKL